MSENTHSNHPLICDPDEGICGIPGLDETPAAQYQGGRRPLKIVYFTDPICSSCWGIEPQLRKLKLEYGHNIEMDYRMGGLLPDWSYNSGGISQPSDVASHWDEVSLRYDMPIDGDLWLEDPLDSSYPPSVAFKAAQMQDQKKAVQFLRGLRELVFLGKRNITRWENLALAANNAGLDVERLKDDFEGGARALFDEDLALGREWGVRGFPTLFFTDQEGKTEKVYGTRPYPFFETALLTLFPEAKKQHYNKTWEALFGAYSSLTAREFSELSGLPRGEAEQQLSELTAQGKLAMITSKNGFLWKMNKTI